MANDLLSMLFGGGGAGGGMGGGLGSLLGMPGPAQPQVNEEKKTDEELTYEDAGVDTREGARAVSLMKEHARRTFDKGVLSGLGGFGSLYLPDLAGVKEPVLVAGADGVGTKLKIAFMMDKHDTVGQDCVAMCVNDVLCQGAKPLFFLDYIATQKIDAEKVADIVKGIADGCVIAGCSLVGGETAEMPGFYKKGEYDLAGFCVGLVDRSKIIDGNNVEEGNVVLGLKSSGLHSNGFSLARKVLFGKGGLKATDKIGELGEQRLGDVLLEPTRIYTKQVSAIQNITQPKALINITGGGFIENISRVMPEGLAVRVDIEAWERPKIFEIIQYLGKVETGEMYSTFNMGIGMMAVVDKESAEAVTNALNADEEEAYVIGEVVSRGGVVAAG